MVSLEEYAYLSEVVYQGKRIPENQLKAEDLEGWTKKQYISDNSKNPTNENQTEFAAGVYQKGNEIVIAFCGTNTIGYEHTLTNIPFIVKVQPYGYESFIYCERGLK